MSPKKVRTCVIYARISLRTDESVSIARQIETAEAYAKARGWKVVGTFRDEGVSATHNRPEDRDGWKALLASPTKFDAVIVWKVDRLARRVLDFLNANEAVKVKGAGLVAVEDPIDMTTAQGEAFAIMLAVFGQMESAAMRDRQRAARNHLLRNGRWPGGVPLYGYKIVPNPSGAGYCLVQNEDEITYVKEIVRRTMAGLTLYSTLKWLQDNDAPTKTGRKWAYTTLDRIVRHPLLAGMLPHNPGNTTSHTRGEDVLRDADGLPVIDEALAVMPVAQWRAMQARLDAPSPQRQPRALKSKSSGLLSGLVWCAEHDEPIRMWRKTIGTKERRRRAYNCRECGQTISEPDALVIARFLETGGEQLRFTAVEEVVEGGTVQLREASVRLAELGQEVVNASPERAAEIVAEMTRLKAVQEEAKGQPAEVKLVPVGEVRTYAEDWAAAEDDEQRRLVLEQALTRVLIRRGTWGNRTDAGRLARMTFEWADGFAVEQPTDAELAAWADEDPTGRAGR